MCLANPKWVFLLLVFLHPEVNKETTKTKKSCAQPCASHQSDASVTLFFMLWGPDDMRDLLGLLTPQCPWVSQRTKSQLQRNVEGIPLSAAQIYKDHCQAQEDLDKGQQRLISRIRQSNGPRETDYLVSLNHFTPAPKC